jgi:hypothetical protein
MSLSVLSQMIGFGESVNRSSHGTVSGTGGTEENREKPRASQFFCRDSNRSLPGYKSEVLSLEPTCSVSEMLEHEIYATLS